eukprot:gnl/TRDRNA2_/TRDRNA2_155503_c0_seq1.p1 gnl/TRDRNA2_/TRDRNA2_155503_c0~~gnl/TRDRNA2_/TRDRNA2_155503_c0_seq1.p1  ORF type:complete len:402 (+),score=60.72 gnl/TRDRNA2_/TRDRNA2_155503_c0_seq1:80-1285(+)
MDGRSLLGILVALGCLAFLYTCDIRKPGDDFTKLRRLAASSGFAVHEVHGNLTGKQLDEKGKALSHEPDWGTSFGGVVDYFIGLQHWDPEGEPTLPASAFISGPAAGLKAMAPPDVNDPQLPVELRGVWCGAVHPSQLACFVPYATDMEFNESGFGLPSQGFRVGKMFFWDSPGTRNTLEFFTRLAAEFQIPKFIDGVEPGLGSGFWTYSRPPFDYLPYPIAVYEGLPPGHHNIFTLRKTTGNAFWDPGTSDDPALCFCSLTYLGNDTIDRNNFGKFAYSVQRVLDGNLVETDKWPDFIAHANARGQDLVRLAPGQELYPDLSCTGWCPFIVFWQVLLFYGVVLLLLFGCCCCCLCIPSCRKRCCPCFYSSKEEDDEDVVEGELIDDEDVDIVESYLLAKS